MHHGLVGKECVSVLDHLSPDNQLFFVRLVHVEGFGSSDQTFNHLAFQGQLLGALCSIGDDNQAMIGQQKVRGSRPGDTQSVPVPQLEVVDATVHSMLFECLPSKLSKYDLITLNE